MIKEGTVSAPEDEHKKHEITIHIDRKQFKVEAGELNGTQLRQGMPVTVRLSEPPAAKQ